jgi:hypothetical protein
MPALKAAHIREQGHNMIIFPLDQSFGRKSDRDRSTALAELERRAHEAGLAGRAVAFWEGTNRTHFMGPRPWHPFLKGLSMNDVLASVNKQIRW